jgi:hypothetical protein
MLPAKLLLHSSCKQQWKLQNNKQGDKKTGKSLSSSNNLRRPTLEATLWQHKLCTKTLQAYSLHLCLLISSIRRVAMRQAWEKPLIYSLSLGIAAASSKRGKGVILEQV